MTNQLPTNPSNSELLAIIAKLQADNQALAAKNDSKSTRGLSLKVSQKGALSIYGLGRFPVTLYKSQVIKLSEAMPDIMAYISDPERQSMFATKGEAAPVANT